MMGYSLRMARETDYDRLLPICKEFYSELGPKKALSNITSTLKGVLARENIAGFLVESEVEINEFAAVSTFHGLEVSPDCELEDLSCLAVVAGTRWHKPSDRRDDFVGQDKRMPRYGSRPDARKPTGHAFSILVSKPPLR